MKQRKKNRMYAKGRYYVYSIYLSLIKFPFLCQQKTNYHENISSISFIAVYISCQRAKYAREDIT